MRACLWVHVDPTVAVAPLHTHRRAQWVGPTVQASHCAGWEWDGMLQDCAGGTAQAAALHCTVPFAGTAFSRRSVRAACRLRCVTSNGGRVHHCGTDCVAETVVAARDSRNG